MPIHGVHMMGIGCKSPSPPGLWLDKLSFGAGLAIALYLGSYAQPITLLRHSALCLICSQVPCQWDVMGHMQNKASHQEGHEELCQFLYCACPMGLLV